ncbi:MAG: dolichyl-phosphate-mannose--protein mannosyltransferase [Candidatus Nanopelagicus sp.]
MRVERLIQFGPIAAIFAFALALRLWRLNLPSSYIFDEVYYAKNAASLITAGVELNDQGESEFVVHPPLGKWLIGIGIKIFGNNEFGWRFSAAIFGSVAVLLIYIIVKKLFASEFLSITAALLFALDGLNLVMSRVALLDIFLMVFILLSFYFLLLNNYLAVSISLGLALATKWSGGFLIPVFLLYIMIENRANLKKILKPIGQLVLVPVIVYLISWSGWIFSDKGWARNSESNLLLSLWSYHRQILNFHQDLVEQHTYQANPWSWLILGRPTSFFYEESSNCGQTKCSQEILAIGTPFLWWSALFAVAITIGFFITNKDRKAAIILIGFAATYLPWFLIQERTTFYFYAISTLPFLILAIIYCFNQLIKSDINKMYIKIFVIFIAINFLYFLPIYLGISIPYSEWLSRMWLESWI